MTSSATTAIGGSKATGNADSKGVEGLSGDMKAVSMTTADSKEISSRAAGSKVRTHIRSFTSSCASECDDVLYCFDAIWLCVKDTWMVVRFLLNAVLYLSEQYSTLLFISRKCRTQRNDS